MLKVTEDEGDALVDLVTKSGQIADNNRRAYENKALELDVTRQLNAEPDRPSPLAPGYRPPALFGGVIP